MARVVVFVAGLALILLIPASAALCQSEKEAPQLGDASQTVSQGHAKPEVYLTPLRVLALLASAALIVVAAGFLLVFPDGRKAVRKYRCILARTLGVEMGIGGFLRLAIWSAFPAIIPAFLKGSHDKIFDWNLFVLILVSITIFGVIQNLFDNSQSLKRMLSPGAGHVWRSERKTATAAILKAINQIAARRFSLETGNDEIQQLHRMLMDLLDVIVLHVRDHRGCSANKSPDVFANVLIDDGAFLTVIARDKMQHDQKYLRPLFVRHPRDKLCCGTAIDQRRVVSVGCLREEYPDGPQNKPYSSILAIPIFSSDNDFCWGALSVDSTREYLFESLYSGKTENSLENSLQPYLQLVTSILELISRDRQSFLGKVETACSTTEHLLRVGNPNG